MSNEESIERILRNKIDKPIKGEITIGKLRWRGIKNLAFYKDEFIGVIQRDKVIGVDGEVKFPLDPIKVKYKYP